MREKIQDAFKRAVADDVAEAAVKSFAEAENCLVFGDWTKVGFHGGHFVEAVYRLLESQLEGSFTPIGKSLKPLNENRLQTLSSKSGSDSLRFHIPRSLFTIYGIRNKKGVGHLSKETTERSDAHYVISVMRWVVSEIYQEFSSATDEEASSIVSQINERPFEVVWKSGNVSRVLDTSIKLDDQILVLLLSSGGSSTERFLVSSTESSQAYVRKRIKKLHKERFIEYSDSDGKCSLTPVGSRQAENVLRSAVAT